MAKRTRKVMASSFPIPGRDEEPNVGRVHPDPTIRKLLSYKGKPGFGYAMEQVLHMQRFGVTVPPQAILPMMNHYLKTRMDNAIRAQRQLDLAKPVDGSIVYFIQFSDRIKIGTTTNLKARLEAIPHDEILATMPGSYETERALHQRFSHLRVIGEWFQASDELLTWIETNATGAPLDISAEA